MGYRGEIVGKLDGEENLNNEENSIDGMGKGQLGLLGIFFVILSIFLVVVLVGLFVPVWDVTTIEIDMSNQYSINSVIKGSENIPVLPYWFTETEVIGSGDRIGSYYSLRMEYYDGEVFLDRSNLNNEIVEVKVKSHGKKGVTIAIDEFNYNEVLEFG